MKPLTLTDSFWIGDGGTVHLSVAGSTVPGVYGFGTSKLVLDGENFYPSGADFATQGYDTYHFVIDVVGHSQLMGGFAGEGANKRPCTLRNSNGRVCPTLTLTQTVDNLTTNLHFEGAFNVVKAGRARLTAGEAVKGDLAVEAGTYALGRKIPGLLARAVTVGRGAVLDLGGQSAACRTLRVEGGTVANGTLRADRIVLKGAVIVRAKLVGDVEVEQDGEEEAVLRGTALETVQEAVPSSYRLPRGTVAYFPFDGSPAAALLDRSGGKVDLSVRSGTPVWEPEGRLGGCIYFDGASTLAAEPFPSTVPVGNAPVTIAAWIRIADACGARGGWLSYGDTANGRGCSLRLNGFDAFNWYANGNDVQGRSNASLADGAWHYVVATSDGTVRKLFCDGTEIGSAKTGLDVLPTLFMLGKTMHDAHFTGWLDDVLIVDRALEPAEIHSLYQTGGVPRPETAAPGRTLGVRSGTLAVLSNDCVANWPFASAETLFADASGRGHDLIVGAGDGAKASADSPFGSGSASGSLELDGKTWLTAEVFPDLPTGNVARTVACFVKPVSGCAEEGAILNWGNEGWASGRYMNFALRSFGRAMGLFPWGAEDRVDFGSADCTRGRWTSFVAVWNGAEIAYYTNGVLALDPRAYGGVASLATDAGGFKVGKAFYGEKSFFKGNLAELAVWDRALSEAEVRDYVRNGVGGTDGLPDSVTLEVAAGATCRVPRGGQVLAGLNGAGTVEGDVTLRAGAVVSVRENGPVVVDGTLTFAGDGTVVLPVVEAAALTRYPLLAADQFVGEANLTMWQCTNVPKGYKATVEIRDGVVEAVVCAGGMAVFIR